MIGECVQLTSQNQRRSIVLVSWMTSLDEIKRRRGSKETRLTGFESSVEYSTVDTFRSSDSQWSQHVTGHELTTHLQYSTVKWSVSFTSLPAFHTLQSRGPTVSEYSRVPSCLNSLPPFHVSQVDLIVCDPSASRKVMNSWDYGRPLFSQISQIVQKLFWDGSGIYIYI